MLSRLHTPSHSHTSHTHTSHTLTLSHLTLTHHHSYTLPHSHALTLHSHTSLSHTITLTHCHTLTLFHTFTVPEDVLIVLQAMVEGMVLEAHLSGHTPGSPAPLSCPPRLELYSQLGSQVGPRPLCGATPLSEAVPTLWSHAPSLPQYMLFDM